MKDRSPKFQISTIKTLSTVIIDIWKPDFRKAQKTALFVNKKFLIRPANPHQNTYGYSG